MKQSENELQGPRALVARVAAVVLSALVFLAAMFISLMTLLMTSNFNFAKLTHAAIYLMSVSSPLVIFAGLTLILQKVTWSRFAIWLVSMLYFWGGWFLWKLPDAKGLIH